MKRGVLFGFGLMLCSIVYAATYQEAEDALLAAEDSANAVWLSAETDVVALVLQNDAYDAYSGLMGTYYYVEDWIDETDFELAQAQIVQELGDTAIEQAHARINEGYDLLWYEEDYDAAENKAIVANNHTSDAHGYYFGWTDGAATEYAGCDELYADVEREYEGIIAECELLAAAEDAAMQGDPSAMQFMLYQMGW